MSPPRNTTAPTRHLLWLTLGLLLPLGAQACGDAAVDSWGGSIDTLANGVLVIRNPTQALWREGEAWTLREDLRIGHVNAEGPELFGQIVGLVVDDAENVYVLDRQWSELRAFGPDGAHRWTTGRKGGGPGEMTDPIGLTIDPAGRLQVTDPAGGRYAFFATDGTFLTTMPRRLGGYSVPWVGGYDEAGRFFERASAARRRGVLRIDSTGVPVDTAFFPTFDGQQFTLTNESASISASVPFAPRQYTLWDRRGYLWVGETGAYRIAQLSYEGDTIRIIERDGVEPLAVTAEEREEVVEGLDWFVRQGGRVDPRRIPETKPLFTGFHVAPDGHLWVVRTRPAGAAGAEYDVFDPRGRFLGPVHAEADLGSSPIFRDDKVYGITSDSLDVRYIVRLRIEPGVR